MSTVEWSVSTLKYTSALYEVQSLIGDTPLSLAPPSHLPLASPSRNCVLIRLFLKHTERIFLKHSAEKLKIKSDHTRRVSINLQDAQF